MPSLTYHFGIKPWDVERMTLREIAEYRRQLREMRASQETSRGDDDAWD